MIVHLTMRMHCVWSQNYWRLSSRRRTSYSHCYSLICCRPSCYLLRMVFFIHALGGRMFLGLCLPLVHKVCLPSKRTTKCQCIDPITEWGTSRLPEDGVWSFFLLWLRQRVDKEIRSCIYFLPSQFVYRILIYFYISHRLKCLKESAESGLSGGELERKKYLFGGKVSADASIWRTFHRCYNSHGVEWVERGKCRSMIDLMNQYNSNRFALRDV